MGILGREQNLMDHPSRATAGYTLAKTASHRDGSSSTFVHVL